MEKLSMENYVCRKCGALTPISECDCEDKLYVDNLPSETIGFLSSYFSDLELDSTPTLKYKGLRSPDFQPDNSLGSGEVMIEALFKSPTGIIIRADVPVLIKNGTLLTPSVIYFGDVPTLVSAAVINSKLKSSTFTGDYRSRDMYDPPLDPKAREMLEAMSEDEKKVIIRSEDIFKV